MGYVEKTLVDGEAILQAGRLHWIVYARGLLLCALGIAIGVIGHRSGDAKLAEQMDIAGVILVMLGALAWLAAWIRRTTTEIAVTNRRFVVKRGLIRRSVMEIGAGQIESVAIDQSIMGRLFGYGTLVVSGTGSGVDPVRPVGQPLKLSRALDRLYRPH